MFYYKDIVLDTENSYEPAEDSLLIGGVLENQNLAGKSLLDMGTGSGLLAIICAKKGADVTAVDIDYGTLETGIKNSKKNNTNIKFLQSNLFSNVKDKFDLIVFNPPYLPVDEQDVFVKNRRDYDGGKTGRRVIERFLKQSGNYLNRNGKIFMLISSLTDKEKVIKMLNINGFKSTIVKKKKIDWEELIVFEIRKQKSNGD